MTTNINTVGNHSYYVPIDPTMDGNVDSSLANKYQPDEIDSLTPDFLSGLQTKDDLDGSALAIPGALICR